MRLSSAFLVAVGAMAIAIAASVGSGGLSLRDGAYAMGAVVVCAAAAVFFIKAVRSKASGSGPTQHH
jgi:hypothetical protein